MGQFVFGLSLLLSSGIRVVMMKYVNARVAGNQKLYKVYHDSIHFVCITIYLIMWEYVK